MIAVEKPMQYSVLRTSLSIVLGMAITLTPCLIEPRRIAERVVAADGDEVLDAERREVGQHLPGYVPGGSGDAGIDARGGGKILAGQMRGQLLRPGRIGAARVQDGPAAPVDGARVVAVERHQVAAPARGVVRGSGG